MFDAKQFKARVLKFSLDYLGLGSTAFEDACGLSHGFVNTIKVKGPSVEVLAKMSEAFPMLNLNWLVTGKGPMLIPRSEQHQGDPLREEIRKIVIEEIKEIKL